MNIVAIVGSNNKHSITKKLTGEVLLNLKTTFYCETELVWLKEYKLDYCLGCMDCFNSGICPLDKADSMHLIKDKLKQADCVIFASPVYVHACSGIMKTFIDRMAYICHLMGCGGKIGFVITTTECNGSNYVSQY